MKIFKDITYAWWQIGLLKLALLCCGIAIGANWPLFFVQYTTLLIILFLVSGLYLGVVWLKNNHKA